MLSLHGWSLLGIPCLQQDTLVRWKIPHNVPHFGHNKIRQTTGFGNFERHSTVFHLYRLLRFKAKFSTDIHHTSLQFHCILRHFYVEYHYHDSVADILFLPCRCQCEIFCTCKNKEKCVILSTDFLILVLYVLYPLEALSLHPNS